MTDRKFPIGPFTLQEQYTSQELADIFKAIEDAPAQYRSLTEHLNDEELSKKYRDDSWNIRQIVHHVADIQFVHYFRMKKAVTEPDYKEVTLIDMNAWAGLPDSISAPVIDSLVMLESITNRYLFFASNLTEERLSLSYFHPIRKIWFTQKHALAMTAWHVQHHLGHIRWALEI